jgi:hypothetical protein
MATAKKTKYTKIGRSGEMIEVEHDEIRKKFRLGHSSEYFNLDFIYTTAFNRSFFGSIPGS